LRRDGTGDSGKDRRDNHGVRERAMPHVSKDERIGMMRQAAEFGHATSTFRKRPSPRARREASHLHSQDCDIATVAVRNALPARAQDWLEGALQRNSSARHSK
jgi:hypothetical protein